MKTYKAKLTVTDAEGLSSSNTVEITVGSQPPIPTITNPQNGQIFNINDDVLLQGSATDPDGGPTPSLSWQVILIHNDHPHTEPIQQSPLRFKVTAHGPGFFYYKVILTATDSTSVTASTEVNVYPVQAPYTNTPVALPGTIQAEDFDRGVEGAAYHDLDPTNNGGQYRPAEGLDIEATTDTGGGHSIGYAQAGEWLEYSVSIPAPGTYTISARVASDGAGGTFHIELNGQDVTGPLTVPDTGGWQNYQTIPETGVNLGAGIYVMRLALDTNGASGYVGNFNYLQVVAAGGSAQSPYGGSPVSLPGTVQAENFDTGSEMVAYHDTTSTNQGGQYRMSEAVDIGATSDTGGGYNIGYILAGEWLEYTVTVASTGTYTLEARVASAGAGGTFHIESNGVNKTGTLTVPNTGSWLSYQTVTKTGVQLSAGQQVLRIAMDTNGVTGYVGDFNHLKVVADGSSTSTSSAPPAPWVSQDIGSVGIAGSATHASGSFTVKGSGTDIWDYSDSFRYVHQPLTGDGQIVARVASVQNTDSWAKAGVMIREMLSPDSKHAMVIVTPTNGVSFQRRIGTGGVGTFTAGATAAAPYWVKLQRRGNTFSASRSADGVTWTLTGTETIPMASTVYVGLAVASHNNQALCTATFDNVTVSGASSPPPTNPFAEAGGQVVIEAENHHANTGRSGGSWVARTNPAGYVGSSAMVAEPNSGQMIDTAYTTTSPELQYQVRFATAGTYYVWLRGHADSTADNSVHVGIDGQAVQSADRISLGSFGAWGWFAGTTDGPVATIVVSSAGVHTINVWMREDGLRLDRLLLTTNSGYVPNGAGPAESGRAP